MTAQTQVTCPGKKSDSSNMTCQSEVKTPKGPRENYTSLHYIVLWLSVCVWRCVMERSSWHTCDFLFHAPHLLAQSRLLQREILLGVCVWVTVFHREKAAVSCLICICFINDTMIVQTLFSHLHICLLHNNHLSAVNHIHLLIDITSRHLENQNYSEWPGGQDLIQVCV